VCGRRMSEKSPPYRKISAGRGSWYIWARPGLRCRCRCSSALCCFPPPRVQDPTPAFLGVCPVLKETLLLTMDLRLWTVQSVVVIQEDGGPQLTCFIDVVLPPLVPQPSILIASLDYAVPLVACHLAVRHRWERSIRPYRFEIVLTVVVVRKQDFCSSGASWHPCTDSTRPHRMYARCSLRAADRAALLLHEVQ